ncbi:MAG: hypothetical protein IT531_25065 [Burkholderiales bacterium]|nr:hypothetical protein [Burkholderiales bacterium]
MVAAMLGIHGQTLSDRVWQGFDASRLSVMALPMGRLWPIADAAGFEQGDGK